MSASGQMNQEPALRYTVSLAIPWTLWLLLALCVPVRAEEPTIRVALFVDRGAQASEFKKEFRRSDDDSILYKEVDGDDILHGALKHFDALLVPGGSALREATSLGTEARDEVRRFVNGGGIYMGVCAGAYLASQAAKSDLGLIPLKTLDADHWYRVDDMTGVDVELTPVGMEVFGLANSNIRINYENGPIFAPPAQRPDDTCMPLGFFRSEVVGDGGERGAMLGAPAIVLAKYGRGLVLALSPHPEETPGLKQVELHALHWLYNHCNAGDVSFTKNSARNGVAIAQPAVRLPIHHSDSDDSTGAPGLTGSDSSKLGKRALKLAESIFDRASVVRYVHRQVPAAKQVITQPDGTVEVRSDCSGFISYIVHSIAPLHYREVRSKEPGESYPQAEIWASFFDTLDSNHPHKGWLGISKWQDLQPGDLIAWKEGKSASGNTGHVMMVLSRPGEVRQEGDIRYIEVPVIDSSSVYHFAPERLPPNAHMEHRDGLGTGCVRIILSEAGAPIGYWAGIYWGEGGKQVKGPTLSNLVRFARMTSLLKPTDAEAATENNNR